MVLTLLNIVLPVFAVSGFGFAFGRLEKREANMAFINRANVMVFCPALIFSALADNPVDLFQSWPLLAAGALIIILPGVVLAFIRKKGVSRAGFLVPGMFRNTGNIGIPLMMLAYGKDLLGDIVILFVISNLLHFSLGLILLSRGSSRWLWLKNPNIWAAFAGVIIGPHQSYIPEFVLTTIELTGQIAIPLMLFGLGVRLSQDRIKNMGVALVTNLQYLLVSLLVLTFVVWALPLTAEWSRLIILSAMLPPAVMNYMLCEQYEVDPHMVANVVLLGNVMSIATIPLVVWATLTFI